MKNQHFHHPAKIQALCRNLNFDTTSSYFWKILHICYTDIRMDGEGKVRVWRQNGVIYRATRVGIINPDCGRAAGRMRKRRCWRG